MNESGGSIPGAGSEGSAGVRDWVVAIVLALAVFVIAYLGFVLVPDRLVARVFEGLVPRTRDALVLLWVAVFFAFMCWLFVRVQRPWRKVTRAVRR